MLKAFNYTLPERLLSGITLAMFSAVVILVLAQVFFRYVMQISVPWTEEMARILFQISVMSGFAFAYKERENIVVDFIFENLSQSTKRALSILYCLAMLGLVAFWATGAWKLAKLNMMSELITISWFKIGYLYYWEFFMLLLLGLYILIDIYHLAVGKAFFTPAGEECAK